MYKEMFTIELAGVSIGIRPRSDHIKRFCKAYIKEGDPEFTIMAEDGDIEEENERATDYLGCGELSEYELEKFWIYRQIAEKMPQRGIFLMHASAIAVDNRAYLLAGPSGAGKTTQTRMWKKEFGDRMRVINDDKPLIKTIDEGMLVCGSPWCGKERWNINITAPLEAVFYVHQATENSIREMTHPESWDATVNQIYRSKDAGVMKSTLAFVDRLICEVPVYRLECNREPESVRIAFEKVNRERD